MMAGDHLIEQIVRWDAEDDEAARGAAKSADAAIERELGRSGVKGAQIAEALALVNRQSDGGAGHVEHAVRMLVAHRPDLFGGTGYRDLAPAEQDRLRRDYYLP